jgi:hypothetical protein
MEEDGACSQEPWRFIELKKKKKKSGIIGVSKVVNLYIAYIDTPSPVFQYSSHYHFTV